MKGNKQRHAKTRPGGNGVGGGGGGEATKKRFLSGFISLEDGNFHQAFYDCFVVSCPPSLSFCRLEFACPC